jgi:hypothetical protein
MVRRGLLRRYNHLGNPPPCRLFGSGLARACSPLSALPSPLKLSDFDKVPGVLETRAVCVSTQICIATTAPPPLPVPPTRPSRSKIRAMPVISSLCANDERLPLPVFFIVRTVTALAARGMRDSLAFNEICTWIATLFACICYLATPCPPSSFYLPCARLFFPRPNRESPARERRHALFSFFFPLAEERGGGRKYRRAVFVCPLIVRPGASMFGRATCRPGK